MNAPKDANPFLSYQIHVNDFTARALNWKNLGTAAAFFCSYGSFAILAIPLVGLVMLVGALGLWLTLTQSAFPTAPGMALFVLDCLAMAGSMAVNNRPMEKWSNYFFGPHCDAIEALSGTDAAPDDGRGSG